MVLQTTPSRALAPMFDLVSALPWALCPSVGALPYTPLNLTPSRPLALSPSRSPSPPALRPFPHAPHLVRHTPCPLAPLPPPPPHPPTAPSIGTKAYLLALPLNAPPCLKSRVQPSRSRRAQRQNSYHPAPPERAAIGRSTYRFRPRMTTPPVVPLPPRIHCPSTTGSLF